MSDQPVSNKTFASRSFLSDEEIMFLERLSIIEPIPSETRDIGFCKVIMPLRDGHSIPIPDDSIDEGKPYQITIPMAKKSSAALEFMGFMPATARELWTGFICQKSTRKSLKLMDYVYEHISLLQTSTFREMETKKALILLGLGREFEHSLFNTQYSATLKFNTLYHLVKHALGGRYALIDTWHKKLKRHARWLVVRGKTDLKYRAGGDLASIFALYGACLYLDSN